MERMAIPLNLILALPDATNASHNRMTTFEVTRMISNWFVAAWIMMSSN